jgi:hypothetical protein
MKNNRSIMPQLPTKEYDRAVETLCRQMESKSGVSQQEIEQAVRIIRDFDPDHPLLRYSERARL